MRFRCFSIFRLYINEMYFSDKVTEYFVQFLRTFSNPDRGLFRSRRKSWQPSDNTRSKGYVVADALRLPSCSEGGWTREPMIVEQNADGVSAWSLTADLSEIATADAGMLLELVSLF